MTGRELLKEQQRQRVEAMRRRKAQEKAKKKADTKRVTGGKAPKTGQKAKSVIEPLVKKVEKRSGSSLAIKAGQKAGQNLRSGRTPDTDSKTKQEPKRRTPPAKSQAKPKEGSYKYNSDGKRSHIFKEGRFYKLPYLDAFDIKG